MLLPSPGPAPPGTGRRHSQSQPMHVPANRPVARKVLLMGTCLCDAFYADAAQASVEVLEHLGVEVLFPRNQTCCGQPAFNTGDWKSSRKVARHCAKVFAGDLPVVVPSGSCAAMNFHGNLLQFEDRPHPAISSLAARTWELFDFIVNGLKVSSWPGSLPAPTRVAYHRNCHTRGTPTPEAAIQLLSSIGNVEVVPFGQADQCCGFGGTFAVVFPHLSGRIGSLKLDHILAAKPDLLCSADLSCLMHISGLAQAQGRNIPCLHAAQILRQALDHAPKPAPESSPKSSPKPSSKSSSKPSPKSAPKPGPKP